MRRVCCGEISFYILKVRTPPAGVRMYKHVKNNYAVNVGKNKEKIYTKRLKFQCIHEEQLVNNWMSRLCNKRRLVPPLITPDKTDFSASASNYGPNSSNISDKRPKLCIKRGQHIYNLSSVNDKSTQNLPLSS